MARLGADVDALEALGRSFRQQAGQLHTIERGLAREAVHAWWQGLSADRFRQTWTASDAVALRTIRHELEQLGERLGRQAAAQRVTSTGGVGGAGGSLPDPCMVGDSVGSGSAPLARSRRTFMSGDTASIPFFSGDNATEVEVAEMDDGTFRIRVAGTYDGSGGIGIAKILGTEGLADLGLSVTTGSGFEVELLATDAESAAAIEDALRGRTESLTNWTIFAGVSADEALSASVGEGAQVLSVTYLGAAAGVEAPAEIVGNGFSADQTGHDETTIDMTTGYRVDRTVLDSDLARSGWNEDGVSERTVVEIVRDPATGDALTARYHREQESFTDLRNGATKAVDTAAGIVTFGNYNDTDGSVDLVVTTHEFDLRELAADDPIRIAAEQDDRGAVARLASSRADTGTVEELRYEGTRENSDRGLGLLSFGGARLRGEGELTLVSHTRDGNDRAIPAPAPNVPEGGGGGW